MSSDPPDQATGDDQSRVVELFGRALEIDAADRPRFLASECRGDEALRHEVLSLLAAAEASDQQLSEQLDARRAAQLLEAELPEAVPRRVGPYKILSELGAGGMGTVYLAERDDDEFKMRVAIKLISVSRLSSDAIRRLRNERQLLATLEHPNIARLLDGGTTEDGLPFVVMEYVDGVRIDEFCERRGLGIRQRVELFRSVCRAVSYAHKNLVVHRDIKPANVLVTEDGVAKLLDFGIAKLLEQDSEATQVTRRLMTPSYASPEQVRGERVSTATDVYSLGALLYQMLTGRPPLDLSGKSGPQIAQIVGEQEPPSPATGFRDLDTVVLAGLHKEPDRRYASVAALDADLGRFLVGKPVEARPLTAWYRVSRWLGRHRWPVIAASIGLAAFAVFAADSTRRLAAERDAARIEAARAAQINDFLVDLFRGATPRSEAGRQLTAREVLDFGVEQLDRELADQPEVRARLLHTMAQVHRDLGLFDEASELAEKALELDRELWGDRDPETAKALELLALVRMDQGEAEEARELFSRAIEVLVEEPGPRSRAYATAKYHLGMLEIRESNDEVAQDLLEEVIPLREELHGPASTELAQALNLAAIVARRLDDPERAETLYRRAIEINERALGSEHPDLAPSLNNLAVLLARNGRRDEAISLLRRALAIYEQAYGEDHPLVAGTLDNLGEQLMHQGRPEEALPLVERALRSNERRFGESHQHTGTSANSLATIHRELGRYDEAIAGYERAIDIYSAALGPTHQWVAFPVSNLAKLHQSRGDFDRARELLLRALDLRRAELGPEHTQVAFSHEDLGDLERAAAKDPAAAEHYRQALAIRRQLDSQEQHIDRLERKLAEVDAAPPD